MQKTEFESAMENLKEMGIDDLLIMYVNRLNPDQQEYFIKKFKESINSELVSYFAICNRPLFTEYLKDVTKTKVQPSNTFLNLN